MGFFKGDIFSKALGMNTQINVIIPGDFTEEQERKPSKLVYVLHGLSDNASIWARFTKIERLAMKYNYIVVMPEVQCSFYTDMKYGPKYFTYISEELPKLIKMFFNISANSENTFIMGQSMGGYGALKCALSYPENYKACAAYSSCTDMVARVEQARMLNMRDEFKAIFGENLEIDPKEDLFFLASQLMEDSSSKRPRFFLTCGTDDFLYTENRKLRDHLTKIGFPYEYKEWKGSHTWDFWDESTEMAFEYFENGAVTS